MQYPVIDLITSAYINNGWSGLDVTEGKNLCSSFVVGSSIRYDNALLCEANLTADTTYVISFNGTSGNVIYANESLFIQAAPFTIQESRFSATLKTKSTINKENASQHNANGWRIFKNSIAQPNPNTAVNVQICLATAENPTVYVPYSQTTDIDKRLKLPLPHYFPHPVIDALTRASAGTQTADDNEILKHYLTPLGIGGI